MTDDNDTNDASTDENSRRPSTTAKEKRPESSNTARSSMRDVSHTPPNQSESANRVFERGGEFEDDDDEDENDEEPTATDGGEPRPDGGRVNASRVFERGGEFGSGADRRRRSGTNRDDSMPAP